MDTRISKSTTSTNRPVRLRVLRLYLGFLSLLATSFVLAFDATITNSPEDDLTSFLEEARFPSFKTMIEQRYIRALVVYSKTDFFFDGGESKGLQIEYLKAYENFLNKNKKESDKIHILFIPVTFNELIPALLSGKGDIAAYYLTITPKRIEKIAFIPGGTRKVNELIIRHKDAPLINRLEDLSGKKVYVLRDSSYEEHLQQLNKKLKEKSLRPIQIKAADQHLLSDDILEMVNSGIINYSVVDDYIAELWVNVFPDIRFDQNLAISKGNTVSWAMRKENKALQKSLSQFAQKYKKGTLLGNILFKRYFENTQWIKNPNTVKELRNSKVFVEMFKQYGQKYKFDYLALMAQAYQESGLVHSSKSHRGAVGIMQLLPSTAADKHVNISDISSLENNIHAGTKYLAFLRQHYYSKPSMTAVDRFAFSWAAYNAGPAKVEKMRKLAQKMGLNPNHWFNHVEVAAGKIIGRETVQYVSNIYKYYITYSLAMVDPE